MSQVVAAIVAIGVGTFAIRATFLMTADRSTGVSEATERVLRMIPPAALAAIVGLQLSDPSGSTGLAARLIAATVAIAVTRVRANLALALAAGMATVILIDAVVP